MRIGLPKGRLLSLSERVLEQLRMNRDSSTYRVAGDDVTFWLLKMCDIPKLVAGGELDVGLAPTEWVEESGDACERVTDTDGYAVRVSVLGKPEWEGRLDRVHNLRVATEYPNLTRRHLAGRARELSVVEVHGSAEAYPPELADLVVDSVETGTTAKRHGLVEVEQLFDCCLHVIVGPAAAGREHLVAGAIGEIVER